MTMLCWMDTTLVLSLCTTACRLVLLSYFQARTVTLSRRGRNFTLVAVNPIAARSRRVRIRNVKRVAGDHPSRVDKIHVESLRSITAHSSPISHNIFI